MVPRSLWITSGAILVLGLAFSVVGLSAPKLAAVQQARLKRGENLVQIGGCADCHTPQIMNQQLGRPEPDEARRLAGHPAGAPDPEGTLGRGDQLLVGPTFTAFRLPFGTVYASNLTPDRETGTGSWTEENFIRSMRTGKHFGSGEVILPPMPWQHLAHSSDDDLSTMFAYLQSLPAVRNQVPANKVDAKAVAKLRQ